MAEARHSALEKTMLEEAQRLVNHHIFTETVQTTMKKFYDRDEHRLKADAEGIKTLEETLKNIEAKLESMKKDFEADGREFPVRIPNRDTPPASTNPESD